MRDQGAPVDLDQVESDQMRLRLDPVAVPQQFEQRKPALVADHEFAVHVTQPSDTTKLSQVPPPGRVATTWGFFSIQLGCVIPTNPRGCSGLLGGSAFAVTGP